MMSLPPTNCRDPNISAACRVSKSTVLDGYNNQVPRWNYGRLASSENLLTYDGLCTPGVLDSLFTISYYEKVLGVRYTTISSGVPLGADLTGNGPDLSRSATRLLI